MRLHKVLSLFGLLVIAINANAVEVLEGVAAIVNDNVITLGDVARQQHALKSAALAQSKTEINEEKLAEQALEDLINQQLQLIEAEKLGIKTTKQEVEKSISGIATRQGLSLEKFKQQLVDSGEKYSDFVDFIKVQLILSKVQKVKIAAKIKLTSAQIKSFKKQKQQKMQRLHLIDWLFEVENSASSGKWRRAKNSSFSLQKELKNDFELMDFSGATKNDLGWRALSSLPAIFVSKLEGIKSGSIVGPIKAPNGFHVLQILEVSKQASISSDQAANILYFQEVQKRLPIWLKELRKNATIEIINND